MSVEFDPVQTNQMPRMEKIIHALGVVSVGGEGATVGVGSVATKNTPVDSHRRQSDGVLQKV